MPAILNWIALSLFIATSAGLLLSRDWRWSLFFLAIQYVSVFWQVQNHWPMTMAATKLVTGWMACAILGIAQLNAVKAKETETAWPQGWLFRLFTAGMTLVVTFALALRVADWLRLSLPIGWSGVLLIGMGLLQLGNTSHTFRVILGLLTVMAGFEILYASVENSILVAALLAVVNLGLAMTGAYLLNTAQEETR